MEIVYLINTTFLKEFTYIDQNIENRYLEQAIFSAQLKYIKPCLGVYMYNKLIDYVKNSNIEEPYTTLFSTIITPLLANLAMAELFNYYISRVTNKNVMQLTAENSNPLFREDLVKIKNEYMTQAYIHEQSMYDEIMANSLLLSDLNHSSNPYPYSKIRKIQMHL